MGLNLNNSDNYEEPNDGKTARDLRHEIERLNERIKRLVTRLKEIAAVDPRWSEHDCIPPHEMCSVVGHTEAEGYSCDCG